MGKQMSKAKWGGGLRNTRRPRSQSVAEPSVVTPPTDIPHVGLGTSDGDMLTLKLQRDELTVYRNRVGELFRKEENIIRGLLKIGQMERAKLLMKKKRFQEHILQETESHLNSIFNQVSKAEIPITKSVIDETIDKNSEALKRLHILLSLEKTEEILKETYEGSKKQFEVDNLLQLATIKERELLEKEVEGEIQKLVTSADVGDAQQLTPGENQTKSGEFSLEVDEKLRAKSLEQVGGAVAGEEKKDDVAGQASSKMIEEPKELKALTDIVTDEVVNSSTVVADDNQSPSTQSLSRQVPITLNLQSSEIANLLPDVPTDPIDANNVEKNIMQTQQTRLPEWVPLANSQ